MAAFVRYNTVNIALKRIVIHTFHKPASIMGIAPCRLCHNITLKKWHYCNRIFGITHIDKSLALYNIKNIHTSNRLRSIVSFKLTDIGEGIKEVSLKEWFVKEGDKVEQFDNICEVQSDKASVTITSRYDGVIKKLYYKIDEIALVGKTLVDIEVEGESDTESEDEDTTEVKSNNNDNIAEEQKVEKQANKSLATPAVRRISLQHKVDLSEVKATGKDGRILKEDILRHINMSADESNVVSEMSPTDRFVTKTKLSDSTLLSTATSVEPDKVVPVTGFKKAMLKTMTESLKIPHFTYSDEVDVSRLVALRTELKEDAIKRGVSLTYMPFLIKAASLALEKYPIINSSLDEKCENLVYKTLHNIGIAMDTPKGLVVPNIKRAQDKTIFQIAAELNVLQDKGNKGSLSNEDITGGTFSLSNIGSVGGTYTKPVILLPQVSIGAVGKIQVLPRFDQDGNVIRASIMCVSFSADHRVIDGVTMAHFSNQWKYYLENPHRFLLDL